MPQMHLVAQFLGISVNQVHFLVCQAIAIACGQLLRCKLPPGPGKDKQRHWFELVTGFIILYIGYGSQRPRLLQLGGYLFCFHNCMIGPFHFFADYLRFIEGREVDRFEDTSLQRRFNENKSELRRASAELRKQLKLLSLHTLLTLWAFSSFKPDQLISEEFARKSFFQRYLFMTVACFSFRQKFYFAWTLSCIANLSAGFGFSGFDSQGNPEYRFATNIHFFAIEFGTSTKTILDSWNTATTRWLRDSVYDRVPKRYAVWCVFIASAIWHGFHPGFYMAFVSAAAITLSGRSCRRYLRPYFLGSSSSRLIYDIITHVCALFCLNYLGIAFLLLKAHHVVYFWRQMRFLGHIVPLLLIIFLPLICSKPTETSELDPSPISVRKTIKLHETIQPSEKSISSHLH